MTSNTLDGFAPPAAPGAADENLFLEFVGRRQDVYRHTFEKMQAKDPGLRKVVATWCWPAFFVPLPWLLYRKLYLLAGAVLVLPIVLGLLLPSLSSSGSAGLSAVIAMLGKPLYVQHGMGKIAKLRARTASDEELRSLVRKAGGVSVAGAVIGTITMIGFFALAIFATVAGKA